MSLLFSKSILAKTMNTVLLSFITTLLIIISVSTSMSTMVSASSLIVDVSGSAGDLAALRLLAATSGTQISLITVCGNCGTSPLAAWSRVRRFANWIGLRSVRVVLGAADSWYDREQLAKSDSMATNSETGTITQPTCRGSKGIVSSESNPFKKFVKTSSSSSSSSFNNPLSSETISNSDLSDWGNVYNTFDLDTWFGLDEEIDPTATVPSTWVDSSMLPAEITSSTATTGSFITSARLSSPAVVAMRDILSGSAVKVTLLVLSSSLTNLADYLRAEQDVNDISSSSSALKTTYEKLNAIHIKGGCIDASASILKAQSGNSPKLTTEGKQKGEWNFAMDPEAATFVLGSSSSSSSTISAISAKIPRYVYTEDMMYYGTLMTSTDWEKITTNLMSADSIFASKSSAGTYQNLFGGSGPLIWLGKAFQAVQETWMDRASDFILVAGAGFFNVYRASEIFVALAVVDPSVQRSLEQQLDVQPKIYEFGSISGGGGVIQGASIQPTLEKSGSNGDETNLRVYTRGPASTLPFWQSVTRNFFGFV